MARIRYLKFGSIFGDSPVNMDVYDNQEGFGDENALCVQLENGVVGYVPITEIKERGSFFKIVGKDNKEYSIAYQKKKIYDDIAYCKLSYRLYDANATTFGTNYIQVKSNGNSASCYIDMNFYNSQNEDITKRMIYIEDDVNMSILINAYLTFSGSGNVYSFAYNQEQILTNVGSYFNKDITINTKFDKSKLYELRTFHIHISSQNTYNTSTNKITFKNLTINGRNVPIKLS